MGSKLKDFFDFPPGEEGEKSESSLDEFIQEVDELLDDLTPEEELSFDPAEPLVVREQVEEEPVIEVAVSATSPSFVEAGPNTDPYAEMRATFLAIMQQVLKPVTRYIKAVINGVEDREVFEVINFTVTPLIDKVEQVELFKQTSALLEFKTALARILATHFGTLSDPMRQELVSSFMQVRDEFDLDFRGNQRAVQNILQFYKLMCFTNDVESEQIRKFFAIGIPSLTWIRRTSVREIASLSGMPLDQARSLKRLAEGYRETSNIKEAKEQAVASIPEPLATA